MDSIQYMKTSTTPLMMNCTTMFEKVIKRLEADVKSRDSLKLIRKLSPKK
jgi:hypothetical protein